MRRDRVVLIGGGEHARVVAETLRAAGAYDLIGVVDPQPTPELERMGVSNLGADTALREHPGAFGIIAFAALDSWKGRSQAVRRLSELVEGWATAAHPAAYVSPTAQLGEGTVVMAGAVVQTGAVVGAHCVINSGAVVEHDVVIGSNVHVASRVAIGGGAEIGDDTFIGLGAAVRDHVRIGRGVVVGMGAVVVRAVGDGICVTGVPAR